MFYRICGVHLNQIHDLFPVSLNCDCHWKPSNSGMVWANRSTLYTQHIHLFSHLHHSQGWWMEMYEYRRRNDGQRGYQALQSTRSKFPFILNEVRCIRKLHATHIKHLILSPVKAAYYGMVFALYVTWSPIPRVFTSVKYPSYVVLIMIVHQV